MNARAGMTLIESLVALVLASLVSAAVISVLATQNRLLRALTDRNADADAMRLSAGVLREELRWAEPGRDVRAMAADSVALRAFRGGGRVCFLTADAVTVAYAGARRPDAGKDSVLLRLAALESVHAVRDASDAPCGAAPGIRLRLDPSPPPAAAYALVFESGSYFMRDRALRYRLGSEGRQPLTDERFATRGALLNVAADSAVAALRLPWPEGAAAQLRVHFVNRQP